MEVTKDNFEAVLPTVLASIDKCDFMSIDAEFTGLHLDNQANTVGLDGTVNPFDTIESAFLRLREDAKAFLIVQFGLSTFTWSPSTNSYVAEPFNFYIYPRSVFGFDQRFTSQSSSLTFLTNHNFDFNKMIYHGIGYLNREQEQQIKKRNEQNASRGSDVDLNEDNKAFIEAQFRLIDEWLNTQSDSNSFTLPACSPFQRRIIFQEVPKKYGTGYQLQTDNSVAGYTRSVKIMKLSQQQIDQSEILGLKEAIGFRFVIDAIGKSKKLVVGHNMFLDLVHMYAKFYEPLPLLLEDFKKGVASFLPNLLDMKLFLTEYANQSIKEKVTSTVLDELHKLVQQDIFNTVNMSFGDGFSRYTGDDKNHEAGFDAYLTGAVFLRLLHFGYQKESQESGAIPPFAQLMEQIKDAINKIYVMRSETHMNLSAPEPPMDYDVVLYVGGFATELKTNDILNIFGTNYGPLRYKWIDDNSLYIITKSSEMAKKAVQDLDAPDKQPRIVLYQDRLPIMEKLASQNPGTTQRGRKRPASDYGPRRANSTPQKALKTE